MTIDLEVRQRANPAFRSVSKQMATDAFAAALRSASKFSPELSTALQEYLFDPDMVGRLIGSPPSLMNEVGAISIAQELLRGGDLVQELDFELKYLAETKHPNLPERDYSRNDGELQVMDGEEMLPVAEAGKQFIAIYALALANKLEIKGISEKEEQMLLENYGATSPLAVLERMFAKHGLTEYLDMARGRAI